MPPTDPTTRYARTLLTRPLAAACRRRRRVLYGAMHVRGYDWYDPDAPDALPREARRVVDATQGPADLPTALFPASGGNIHMFTAVADCAVLDILSPPYCTDDGAPPLALPGPLAAGGSSLRAYRAAGCANSLGSIRGASSFWNPARHSACSRPAATRVSALLPAGRDCTYYREVPARNKAGRSPPPRQQQQEQQQQEERGQAPGGSSGAAAPGVVVLLEEFDPPRDFVISEWPNASRMQPPPWCLPIAAGCLPGGAVTWHRT